MSTILKNGEGKFVQIKEIKVVDGVCIKQGLDKTFNKSITGGQFGEEELFVMKMKLFILNTACICYLIALTSRV